MGKIAVTYDNKEYLLEYNRQSVKTLEAQGFILSELAEKPATMIPMLFQGAFFKNHKGIKRGLVEDIFEEMQDKTGLLEALVSLYSETLSTLTEDKGDQGNASWALMK